MNEIEKFQAYLLSRDKSQKTIQGYAMDLRQFQTWLGMDRSLASMLTEDVRKYRDHMMAMGASPNTISRRLAALASFGQWGTDQAHLFSENPALHVEPVQVTVLAPRWLDKSQKRKLLSAIDEGLRTAREKYPRLWLLRLRDAVMVNFLLGTGLRVGELCGLMVSDLTIGERKGLVLVRNGKGRKQRLVPLSNEMRKWMGEWLKVRPEAASDRVFIGQRGEPVPPRIVQRVVSRYAEQAGLEDVTPHTLRHTFAKAILDSGANPFEVAKLLGHSSLDSTARYTQPSEDDLMNAVEMLGKEE